MFRFSLSVVILGLALTACQQTRMGGVQPKPAPVAQSAQPTPVTYNDPVIVQPPPYTPPEDHTNDNVPVVPTYEQPPSIREPEAVQPVRRVEYAPLPDQGPVPQSRPSQSVPSVAGQCGPVALNAVEKIDQAKLDVVFVVDTSKSMRVSHQGGQRGELAQIASQMEQFVSSFPENTDINIGVLLGHGTGKHVGKLFHTGKNPVLRTKDFRSRAELVRRLEATMNAIPNESQGAQGEALMFSLYQAIKNAGSTKKYMFRPDASLAVILVSDEQDVCFDYTSSRDPSTGQPYLPVGKNGQPTADPIEDRYFKNTCARAYGGGLLTPTAVDAELSQLKGADQKVILMGMVYTSKELAPQAGREDENEMGHGIIELVGHKNGKLVDLGSVQDGPNKFAAELKFLGEYTKSEIASNGNISCRPTDVNARAVDLASVKVQLQNAQGQTIGLFSADCANGACGEGRGGLTMGDNRRVLQTKLETKTLNYLLNAHRAKDVTVIFTFVTRTDRDPQTGAALR